MQNSKSQGHKHFIKFKRPDLEVREIADDESRKIFCSLKPKKSSEYDDISSDIVRIVFNEVFSTTKH